LTQSCARSSAPRPRLPWPRGGGARLRATRAVATAGLHQAAGAAAASRRLVLLTQLCPSSAHVVAHVSRPVAVRGHLHVPHLRRGTLHPTSQRGPAGIHNGAAPSPNQNLAWVLSSPASQARNSPRADRADVTRRASAHQFQFPLGCGCVLQLTPSGAFPLN
jgi:hypothetical protein